MAIPMRKTRNSMFKRYCLIQLQRHFSDKVCETGDGGNTLCITQMV